MYQYRFGAGDRNGLRNRTQPHIDTVEYFSVSFDVSDNDSGRSLVGMTYSPPCIAELPLLRFPAPSQIPSPKIPVPLLFRFICTESALRLRSTISSIRFVSI